MRVVALAALLLISPVALARAGAPARPVLFTAQGPNGIDVFLAGTNGGDRLSLSGGVGRAVDPRWSRDGTRIAFVQTGIAPAGIYVASADGSGATRLAANDGIPSSPAWSPDGSAIGYLVNTNGAYDVWTVPTAGGGPRQLTRDGGQKTGLAWSPDGSALLYVQQGSDGQYVTKVDADDGGVHRLARGLAPVWSPDGSQVAYVDGNGRVAVMGADGRGSQELTTLYSQLPAWSPDGSTVVFQASFPETSLQPTRYGYVTRTDLYAARPDGTEAAHRVTGPFDQLDVSAPTPGAATFSPDGARLFFRMSGQAWSANADGTCVERWYGFDDLVDGPYWQPGSLVGGTTCIDLYAHARVDPAQAALNQSVQVQIAVENHGNLPARGVILRAYPSGPFTSVQGCTNGECPLGTIPPGGSQTVYLTVAGSQPGNRGVQFSVIASTLDPTPGDAAGVAATTVLDCTKVGTWGPDHLQGTPARDKLCGLPGPDWLSGGKGNDYLDGGSGNDTIFGGPGHDTIFGGGGRDVIFARDGQRDSVDCGPQYDVAVVDKLDDVRHCERVLRK